MRFRNVPGDVLEKPRQAQPDPPVGLLPLIRQDEPCRPGIVRCPVTFQEALLDQRIHQTGGRAFLYGKDPVKLRQTQFPLFRDGVQDHELMERDAPADRFIPAAAPYLTGEAHDDVHYFPAVFIEVR